MTFASWPQAQEEFPKLFVASDEVCHTGRRSKLELGITIGCRYGGVNPIVILAKNNYLASKPNVAHSIVSSGSDSHGNRSQKPSSLTPTAAKNVLVIFSSCSTISTL